MMSDITMRVRPFTSDTSEPPVRLRWQRGIFAALLGTWLLAAAQPVSAQSRDDFSYWDANGNGDLTCSEAEDRDEGLRLPAYRDDRDGTGIIYEWLERRRSSDTDNDGIACDSASNPNGYVPNAQPVDPQGCAADAPTWRGLQVCGEQPRDGYDRDAFGSAYSSLEDEIIAALPATMKANGQVYTPYSCIAFDITRLGPRRRTSSTSLRSQKRTIVESLTTGGERSLATSLTSRSRIRR